MPTTEDQRQNIRLIIGQAVDEPIEVPDSVLNLMWDGPGASNEWATAKHVLLWLSVNAARYVDISTDGQSLTLSQLQTQFERAARMIGLAVPSITGTLEIGHVGQRTTTAEYGYETG